MPHPLCIGINNDNYDPFWVEVNEAIYQSAEQRGVNVIELHANLAYLRRHPNKDANALIDEVLAQHVDAIISWDLPGNLALRVLEAGVALVCNGEDLPFQHPLLSRRTSEGLYAAGHMLGDYVAGVLGGHGNVLIAGGLMRPLSDGDGRHRLAGLRDAFQSYAELHWSHIPTYWTYEEAYPQIREALAAHPELLAAVIGISDTLALAARDAASRLNRLDSKTLIAGINGDIPILAAIADGSFTATVETPATDFGRQMLDIACNAAQRLPFPEFFAFKHIRLVTAENVKEVAAQRLFDTANLPHRLIQTQRHLEGANAQLHEEIAERKQAEAQVRKSEKRYRDLVENTQALLYSHNLDGILLWVNPAAAHLLDYEPSDMIGRNLADYLASSVQPLYQNYLARIRQQSIATGVLRIKTRNGTEQLWMYRNVRFEEPGEMPYVLGWAQDITEQRQLDQARLELAVERERRNTLRLFIDALSHDLRTPLTVINTSLYLLDKIEDPAAQEQRRKVITEQVWYLQELVQNILTLAELEDVPDFTFRTLDLNRVVGRVKTQCSPLADDKAITIAADLAVSLPDIWANEVELYRALVNLLTNAIRYTPAHGIVTIQTHRDHGHVILEVRDTGIGINPTDLPRIFDHFYRAKNAIAADKSGTGLGLAIVKKIIELHNGSIEVESSVNVGTTFRIYLPIARSVRSKLVNN